MRATYGRIIGTNIPTALSTVTGSIVPAGETWQIGKLRITNIDTTTPYTIRLAHRLAADGATGNRDYLIYDKEVPAADFLELEGIVMATGDQLVASSATGGGSTSTSKLYIQLYGARVNNV